MLGDDLFSIISGISAKLGVKSYVVGGYVRDKLLNRQSKDIDIVSEGSGIELAEKAAIALNTKKISVFKNYGTAQIKVGGFGIEFVGARKESYNLNSRKPDVEPGTLTDDLKRRDFTVNALAVELTASGGGKIIDLFGGLNDLKSGIIRTPLDPSVTFSDDPLRMMRAVRFANTLNFNIEEETKKAISGNKHRLSIVSRERIADEFNKILMSVMPSTGLWLLEETGLLKTFFPQLSAMRGVDINNNIAHKENFEHTLQVVDHVSAKTDNLWLRWAALLHDIGKPRVKHFCEKAGWTFHGHEVVGARMVPQIFSELRLPLNEKMKYVQKLVSLHLRPIALVENVTDSAVRRMVFEAGDDINDLMLLAEADITSKNEKKVKLYLENFKKVRMKIIDVEEKDRIRNFQPPVTGEEIMEIFSLPPCKTIGDLKTKIKDAILDGVIPNERNAALEYLVIIAKEMNLTVVNKPEV